MRIRVNFDPASPHKIIDFMADQSDELEKGGTMRLGAYPCLTQRIRA